MGKHMDSLSESDLESQLKALLASIIIYSAAVSFAKTSILLQYLRIFPYKTLRVICYTMMALLVPWTIIVIFSSVFLCTPVYSFIWTASTTANEGMC